MMKFLFASLCLSYFITGCGSSSDDGINGVVNIPDIGIECLSISATQCLSGNAGKPVFIGVTSDLSISCRNLFDSTTISTLTPSFEASGFDITGFRASSPAAVTGNVASWKNQNSNSIEILADKEYKFCAVIDVNNDNQLNDGEPIMDQTNLLSDLSQLTLDNWSNYVDPTP